MGSGIGRYVDLHYIISRIINKHLGYLNVQNIYERDMAQTLDLLRESMWRACGSSGGICDEDIVVSSLESLRTNYTVNVIKPGAPYSVKMRLYKIYRDLVDEINRYGRSTLGRDLVKTDWLEEPKLYSLQVKIRGKSPPREAYIEVVGSNDYREREEASPKGNVFRLAGGEYSVRLVINERVAAQKQIFLQGDAEVELAYQEIPRSSFKQKEIKSPRPLGILLADSSVKMLYVSIALIIASAVFQILRP